MPEPVASRHEVKNIGSSPQVLPLPRKQEGFLCHLGDHDFFLSVPAVQWTLPVMKESAQKDYKLSAADCEGNQFKSLYNVMVKGAQEKKSLLEKKSLVPYAALPYKFPTQVVLVAAYAKNEREDIPRHWLRLKENFYE